MVVAGDEKLPFTQSRGSVFGRSILHDQILFRPGGVKNHHAYKGGLLQHVVSQAGTLYGGGCALSGIGC